MARAARRGSKVGHLPLAAVRDDAEAALARTDAKLVVADAIDDDDLIRLGRAARGHRLVTGGSGILIGLPANFGIEPGDGAAFAGRAGPGLVLAGSCSAATLRQVAAYAAQHPVLRLTAEDALEPEAAVARAVAFVEAHRGAGPMVTSSDGPEAVAAAQARFGRERLAAGVRGDLRAAGRGCGGAGVRADRGGRGRDLRARWRGRWARWRSRSGRRSIPGCRRSRPPGEPRLALALKSGNFGGDDFLARAMRVLEGTA